MDYSALNSIGTIIGDKAFCGVVARIETQSEKRNATDSFNAQNSAFRKLCIERLSAKNAIVMKSLCSEVVAVFRKSEILKAAECVDELRGELMRYRQEKRWKLLMRASLCEGNIDVKGANDFNGKVFDDSMSLNETTQMMQIALTQDVRDDLEKDYQFVERVPTLICGKRSNLYYLHLKRTN